MTRGGADRRTKRLFRDPAGQDETFDAPRREAEAARAAPVRCRGLAFADDDARRAHFPDELRAGLEELRDRLGGVPFSDVDDAAARMAAVERWPMGGAARLRALAGRMARADRSKDLLQRWKDEVGLPKGEIDDILRLSDPPWHTACPNPFLGAFAAAHGAPYRRKPFAVDVREGKTHAVYRAHGYHTKVPYLAIVPSILHYTEPGDLVLDGFAGSGMTGVAAQWCGTAPENYRRALEARWEEDGFDKPRWGARRDIERSVAGGRLHRRQLHPAVRRRRLRRRRARASGQGGGGDRLDVRNPAHRRQDEGENRLYRVERGVFLPGMRR